MTTAGMGSDHINTSTMRRLYGNEYWFNEDNELHRPDGYALIENDKKELWFNGRKLTEEEFKAHPKTKWFNP